MEALFTVISGTNRPHSNTAFIADYYYKMLIERKLKANLISLEGLHVDKRTDGIIALEQKVLIPSTHYVFIVPEYNGSYPGVLKSLIDNSDINNVWVNKKALLTGVSTGRAGNLRGMDHLATVLQYLKMHVFHDKLPISGVNKILNAETHLPDNITLHRIHKQLDAFVHF